MSTGKSVRTPAPIARLEARLGANNPRAERHRLVRRVRGNDRPEVRVGLTRPEGIALIAEDLQAAGVSTWRADRIARDAWSTGSLVVGPVSYTITKEPRTNVVDNT